jgi:hypothetical protein
MKNGSTLFLKIVVLLVALVVLVGMVFLPQNEGRATNLDLMSIYADPLVIYMYIASIPFFIGLYQAFRLLNLIDANKAFSKEAFVTLKRMKYASLALIGFIAGALVYIRFFVQGEDPAGPTMLGILMAIVFAVVVAMVTVFQKVLKVSPKKTSAKRR